MTFRKCNKASCPYCVVINGVSYCEFTNEDFTCDRRFI